MASPDVPMKQKGTRRTALLPGIHARGDDDGEDLRGDRGKKYRMRWNRRPYRLIGAERCLCCRGLHEGGRGTGEEALRSEGFARPAQIWDDVPAYQKEELEGQIADCRQRIAQIEEEIRGYADQREKLKIVADYYRVRADKYAVLGQLPQSRRTFVISGYIPRSCAQKVAEYLTGKYDCAVDIEDLKEDEEAPVILKNNPFSANMEGVVESYGLPAKGEIDPTTIMSFFYVFFFGMMLSDAAYGLIVAVVCGILVWKFPRMSAGMRKSLKLFFYCGLSTVVWGVLFGGYFGNIVDIVSAKFFGRTITPRRSGSSR